LLLTKTIAIIEQARREAILELARARHKPAAIYKLLKYPKTTVCRVFNAWEADGKVCRKTHNMRSDKIRTPASSQASRSPSRHRRDFLVQVGQEPLSEQAAGPRVKVIPNGQAAHPHGIHEGHQAHQRQAHGGRIIFCSDEKNWTVDRSYNVQNDRWLAKEREKVPAVFTTKFPASVMTLGVICSTGEVMPPFFFNPKKRVNAERYCEVMEEVVIPWMKDKAAGRAFIFQQDSAPAHIALRTTISSTLTASQSGIGTPGPPTRPTSIREVCKVSHNSIEALKSSITREWNAVDPAEVIRACKSFRGRMEKMVAAEGGHIE
ncbi:Uncharacterized protein FKW44_010103, partial [Caligus rogercresseyi]